MGFRRPVRAALAAGIACAAVSGVAHAAPLDRVRIAGAGGSLTASLPATVYLGLVPPGGYGGTAAGATHGTWSGPEYWASGRRDVGGRTAIEWTVRFENGSRSSEAAARAGLTHSWATDLSGGVSVPHAVLGRTLGTIDGDYVLTAGAGADNASYELSMAFAVAPRVNAVVDFVLAAPGAASSPSGDYLVQGTIPAPLWNRGQALHAMAGVRLEGNLPPTRVSATVAGGGSLLRGTLADAFRHPVVRQRVALERLVNGRWRRLTTTRTDFRGGFSFRIGTAGSYRVASTLGRTTIRSRALSTG